MYHIIVNSVQNCVIVNYVKKITKIMKQLLAFPRGSASDVIENSNLKKNIFQAL